jgi:hypothetical protein
LTLQDLSLVQRIEFIKELCTGRSVLHLGCSGAPYTKESIENDSLLHKRLAEVASSLTGVDNDALGLEELRRAGFQDLILSDIETIGENKISGDYQVIVAGEIIEHLDNPGLFLSGLRKWMNDSTLLIITTINAYCGMRFLQYGLRGRGGSSEPVHPDHVAYYSYSTLRLLLRRNGFAIESFHFYDLGSEHRKHNKTSLNLLNDVCVTVSKQWADGLVAVCKKADN